MNPSSRVTPCFEMEPYSYPIFSASCSSFAHSPAVNFVVKLVDCGDGTAMSDITVRFIDESKKELGRDYFVAPLGQCTVSGYGNIKTITPRGIWLLVVIYVAKWREAV